MCVTGHLLLPTLSLQCTAGCLAFSMLVTVPDIQAYLLLLCMQDHTSEMKLCLSSMSNQINPNVEGDCVN